MNIENLLHDKHLKFTTARKELFDIFSNSQRPVCYEDIRDNISMDKATFYRNMSTFEEKGIVNSFESNDKKRYYELQSALHSHFVCTVCGNIECLNIVPDTSLCEYEIDNIIIHGRCPKCKQS
ncbi:MAG: transcriptional repressor [Campylobacterales bacterium]|nr:transcriptional repressor [Campylobacterales bacterium]